MQESLFKAAAGVFLASAAGCARPSPMSGALTSPRAVRVAGIVLKWVRGDKEANFRRAEPMIREAAARGARIVCTTECFLDGYAIKDKTIPLDAYRALGEPVPDGVYCRRLADLARALDITLVAGMLEADGDKRYNTAVVLGPRGNLIGRTRKQKLEHELQDGRNTPGGASVAHETPHGRAGVLICADRRDPAIARRLRDDGAAFLLCPSGGMFGEERNDPIVQARSRETGLPIVFIHPAEFLVTGADGRILARTMVGDELEIAPGQAGGPKDVNGVFTCDLTISSSPPPSPPPP